MNTKLATNVGTGFLKFKLVCTLSGVDLGTISSK